MALPQPRRTFWQSATAIPRRTPLQVKLIVVVLALVTVALAVISVAGFTVLRGYLLGQADRGLADVALHDNIRPIVEEYLATGQKQGFLDGFSIQWLPANGKVQQVSTDFIDSRPANPGPLVQHGAGWLAPGVLLPKPVTVSAASGGGRWRVISSTSAVGIPPVHGTIILGLDVTSVYRTLNELAVIDWIISAVLLLGLAILGVALIRSSMRPLTDIERTAEAIAAGDMGSRVPERDPRTEVGKLGRSLNLMLAQIEAAFRARTSSEEAALRSEEAARRSALAASRSEDRMRQFVADASHELRTPLTAIRGYAEYYRQHGGLDGAERNRVVERVEQEAARMGVLVDDLLLLARLDQQRQPDARTVDLLAIAADALHDARVIAPGRTINLTVGTSEAPLVTGDEAGLRQVVGNLMSNATTHTPDGSPIDITIRSGTLGDGGPAVVLEIADSGPGLSDEQKERVFERFYRTDRARTRTAGGTGLGLAIVAALISAHHGQVWVESELGKGATFGFALPLAPEARPVSQ